MLTKQKHWFSYEATIRPPRWRTKATRGREHVLSAALWGLQGTLGSHLLGGWYGNNRPTMTSGWKRRRRRAWDWIKAVTLKQMVSEETHPRAHSGPMSEDLLKKCSSQTSMQFLNSEHDWTSLSQNSLSRCRKMMKCVGQTAGRRAVKGYVNDSVPSHFSRAGRSPSTGAPS